MAERNGKRVAVTHPDFPGGTVRPGEGERTPHIVQIAPGPGLHQTLALWSDGELSILDVGEGEFVATTMPVRRVPRYVDPADCTTCAGYPSGGDEPCAGCGRWVGTTGRMKTANRRRLQGSR